MTSARYVPNQVPRDQVPEGESLCSYCTAKCCKYVALPIDKPKTWADFDTIRWYLAHQDITIFVETGTWYIMLHRECTHLLSDHRCGIYHDRMQICRDYTTEKCEYEEDYLYEMVFETDDQIWDYAEALLGPEKVPGRSADVLTLVTMS